MGKWYHNYIDCNDPSRCSKTHILRPLTNDFEESGKSHAPGFMTQLNAIEEESQKKIERQRFLASQLETVLPTPKKPSRSGNTKSLIITLKKRAPQLKAIEEESKKRIEQRRFFDSQVQTIHSETEKSFGPGMTKSLIVTLKVPTQSESTGIGKERGRKRRRLAHT